LVFTKMLQVWYRWQAKLKYSRETKEQRNQGLHERIESKEQREDGEPRIKSLGQTIRLEVVGEQEVDLIDSMSRCSALIPAYRKTSIIAFAIQ
jgi:hypothetical protein